MPATTRLVTFVDVDDPLADTVSVSARHEVELADGSRVLLLADRGWGSTQTWATTTVADVRETTRVVVGPDEPFGDHTQADMAAAHWAFLRSIARQRGVETDLSGLPHDVVLGPEVLVRIAR